MTNRAVIYARVSTPRQAEADLSIPDQLQAARYFCEQRGWTVVAEYVDKGLTATDDNRPEFQRMIDEAEQGVPGFDYIVVHSQSRFMRDAFLAELYRRKLRKVRVEIVSVTQDFGEGPTAEMMVQMVGLFDEFSSKENSKHVRRAMLLNAKGGFINGKAPFGYKAVEAERRGEKIKKRLDIEPDEAAIIRIMFDLAKNGPNGNDPLGCKEIAKELSRRNLTKRNGRSFTGQEVHQYLTSTTYVGRHVYNRVDSKTGQQRPPDQWVIVAIPSIVDEATFDAVQAAMRARDPMRSTVRFTGHPTLLSNLARCGTCGAAMSLGTGKGGKYRYYVCSRARRAGAVGCPGRNIPEGVLDDLVIDHLAGVLFAPDRLRGLLDDAIRAEHAAQEKAPRQLDSLVRRKADLEGRVARMHRAIELGTVEFDDASFADRLKGLKAERVQTDLQIAALRDASANFRPLTPVRLRAFSGALSLALRDGEARTRRAYLRYFLDRVVVHAREVQLVGHKGPIARAYAHNWEKEALSQSNQRRSALSVPTQVGQGQPLKSLAFRGFSVQRGIGKTGTISDGGRTRVGTLAAWREDHRRDDNGRQDDQIAALAMRSKPSVDFCGYWQRSAA